MNTGHCARENLQNLFDRAFISGDNNNLREYYKELRRMELIHPHTRKSEYINISSLVENITLACDILISGTGISFVFCGNETSHIRGNSKEITKAILNLLSNAYLYSRGNLITVKTIEFSEYIKIEIKNEGSFCCEKYGRGLSFVQKLCTHSDGAFFIETDLFSTTAIMLIKKAPATNCKDFYSPDFYEYLNDRLSPVYVEMFGMEYH